MLLKENFEHIMENENITFSSDMPEDDLKNLDKHGNVVLTHSSMMERAKLREIERVNEIGRLKAQHDAVVSHSKKVENALIVHIKNRKLKFRNTKRRKTGQKMSPLGELTLKDLNEAKIKYVRYIFHFTLILFRHSHEHTGTSTRNQVYVNSTNEISNRFSVRVELITRVFCSTT